MKHFLLIFVIFSLLFTATDTFARSRARGIRGNASTAAADPDGFDGAGILVELPAQGGNFLMTGIGTFIIYPVLFYVQGLASGFSSDRSWGTAKSIATYTFGYLGYYTFGTPCWLIKKLLWDIPLFCLGMG